MDSNVDELKKSVRRGDFGAITLDTSIFIRAGLQLESGLLKQLHQFQQGSTRLILSEVVKEELILHLIEGAEKAVKGFENSLKEVKKYRWIEEATLTNVKELVFGGIEAQEITFKRFESFAELTHLEIIKAQEYVDIGDLIQKYFKAKPPFSTGKKKSEFPDAIALMSLEAWANKNQTKIIVVSVDNDWRDFCKNYEILVHLDDLGRALGLFQLQDADDICKYLSERFYKGELNNVIEAIDNALADWTGTDNLHLASEASSYFTHELELIEVSLCDFEFKPFDTHNLIFRPVYLDLDNDVLVAESKLGVNVDIDCRFSSSIYDPIDKDDVSLGTDYTSDSAYLDINILVSFKGNLKEMGAKIEVDKVEIEAEMIDAIDFHSLNLEPDWSDREDEQS